MTKNNKSHKKTTTVKLHLAGLNVRRPEASPAMHSSPQQPANIHGEPVFFWKEDGPDGFLCQWYRCTFVDPELEGLTFNCAEQYMMYKKAMLFNDTAIAAEIMKCTSPRKQKGLAREVKNFDEAEWIKSRSGIVERGNMLKFSQATNVASFKMGDVGEPIPLRGLLLGTQDRELAEASPFDRVWGIGYRAEEALSVSRGMWGHNLLGHALMAVRRELRGEDEDG